jgi:MoaA/NifB/PqqE/SkfB family radical SAM enzyme
MPEPELIAARLRQWSADTPQGPMTLEVYPTLRCNLDCAFCDTTDRHRPPMDELPLARHLEIVEEAAAMGARRVFILGGGEPLLAKEITPALMRRVKQLGLEGILTTNGTLFPPALMDQVLDDAWDELHFSIDGADAETHDALRGVKGAFKRTVTHACRLRVLKERRGLVHPRLALHTVITQKNHHQLAAIVRLAHALGAFRVDFDGLIAYRPEQQALALGPAARRALVGFAKEGLEEAARLGVITTLARFVDAEGAVRGEAAPPAPPPGLGLGSAPCLKAWHYLVVQANGRSSPCCVLAGEGESVATTSLREVWERGAYLQGVRAGMLRGEPTPRCRECSPNILAHEAVIRDALNRGPG